MHIVYNFIYFSDKNYSMMKTWKPRNWASGLIYIGSIYEVIEEINEVISQLWEARDAFADLQAWDEAEEFKTEVSVTYCSLPHLIETFKNESTTDMSTDKSTDMSPNKSTVKSADKSINNSTDKSDYKSADDSSKNALMLEEVHKCCKYIYLEDCFLHTTLFSAGPPKRKWRYPLFM
jgi:hypothetical protein